VGGTIFTAINLFIGAFLIDRISTTVPTPPRQIAIMKFLRWE
jgi:hypothetical protein